MVADSPTWRDSIEAYLTIVFADDRVRSPVALSRQIAAVADITTRAWAQPARAP